MNLCRHAHHLHGKVESSTSARVIFLIDASFVNTSISVSA